MKIKFLPVTLILLFQACTVSSQTVPQPVQLQPGSRPRVIVFVHGLHGSRESWRAANGAYWPDMVRTDPRFAYSDVDVAGVSNPFVQRQDVQRAVGRHPLDSPASRTTSGTIARSSSSPTAWVASSSRRCSSDIPTDAATVRFIVSYGTPHEGSPVARIASIYDKDPLLNDLSDASDNAFLTQLEEQLAGTRLRQRHPSLLRLRI